MKTTNTLLCLLVLALAASRDSHAQPWPAELRIQRQPAGPVRLELFGDIGYDYAIEAADNPGTNGWSPLVTLSLTGNSQTWLDSGWCGRPRRFYRSVTYNGPAPVESAPSFRLIDQLGKSRELDYHWTDPNVVAFVLVFTADGCASARHFAPALAALRSQFEPQKIRFWLIDSSPLASRSNLVAEAAALGLALPVLHDRAQLVARAYHATTAPEAIGVSRGEFGWSIFYRGGIDDRKDTNTVATTQHYLANALTQYLANGPVTPKRTQPDGCALPLAAQPPASYAVDIAPLLQAKCVRCHSPGNIGPWAMTNYSIVRSYAGAIRDNVMGGHMPPWHADPEYGVFTNDFSLKPAEAAQLVQWIDDGAPRGEGPDLLTDLFVSAAVPTNFPFAWPHDLGEPDAIISIPVQQIPAFGVLAYRPFILTNPFPSNVWLRAAVVRPSNPGVVHHAAADFGSNLSDIRPRLNSYVPGQDPVVFPAGTGKYLARGTNIIIEVHYTPNGQAGTDQTSLGLYVMPSRPPRQLITRDFGQDVFTIPAGTQEYEMPSSLPGNQLPLAKNIILYSMDPHMHVRGTRMKYEVLYPDGRTEVLLSVPHYHFHWQTLYELVEPKRLPAGSILKLSGAFDNSAQNPGNPDPTRSVDYGLQSTDEMFFGFLNYAESLTILTQPRSANAVRGSRVTLSVSASSPNPPVTYQWQFNGEILPGATNTSFTLTNVQPESNGRYTVTVWDTGEALASQPAILAVGDPPVITQSPVAQTVPLGSNATFSATVTGTPPFGFSWRKGSIPLTNIVQNETTSMFTLINVRTNDAGSYRLVVTNAFNMVPGVASPLFTLTVTAP